MQEALPGVMTARRSFEERLIEAGITIPDRARARPWRLVKKRPKLIAFLYRLFT